LAKCLIERTVPFDPVLIIAETFPYKIPSIARLIKSLTLISS
jgi:hypothetical protein